VPQPTAPPRKCPPIHAIVRYKLSGDKRFKAYEKLFVKGHIVSYLRSVETCTEGWWQGIQSSKLGGNINSVLLPYGKISRLK
jgi:hypothetical protein